MACATLKRNFDWDVSMSQVPAKRRRCAPISKSPGTGIKVEPTTTNSIFGESVCASAKLSPERLLQELCNEMKRLRRRRQLRLASGANASCSSSSGSEGDSSPTHHSFPTSSKQEVHKALFTFKQVRLICERMLREQEAALRAEYDSALNNKLAEQYEAFVRFNIDQVQRRPPPSTCIPLGMDTEHMHQDLVPSYLS